MADRRAGGRGGCPPHWKAWSPPPRAELVSLFQEEEVSPRRPGLFSETERRTRAARAWDHAVSAAPGGATPAIQVKAALQRKQRDPDRQGPSSVFPRPNGRGMSEPEQFHKLSVSIRKGTQLTQEKSDTAKISQIRL